MKKYFLMCATLVAALNMMSCKPDTTDGPGPDPQPKETKFNLDEAVYYGEKIAKDVGYYTINLVDANNSSNKRCSHRHFDLPMGFCRFFF